MQGRSSVVLSGRSGLKLRVRSRKEAEGRITSGEEEKKLGEEEKQRGGTGAGGKKGNRGKERIQREEKEAEGSKRS